MDTPITKQQIRQNIIALRNQLPANLHESYSGAIAERLSQLPAYQQASGVLGYMNFGAEFASRIWVQKVLADGKRLLLPKVNQQTQQLDLFWVHDLENQLASGLWGIPEPIIECCEQLGDLNKVEFVLLPGVAFTRDGSRLGYGGGFYDKLIARMTHRPTLVAAAFSLQIVEHLPQEPTDVKVYWLVSEQSSIHCSHSE